MSEAPRIVISAPSTTHATTSVAIGLLSALSARQHTASGFVIGPDYTDASYLGMACGKVGRNLDGNLTGTALIPGLFANGSAGTDIAIISGRHGLFDSNDGNFTTAQVAQQLRAPVVLVVDVTDTAETVAAVIHGFKTFDPLVWLAGVILTGVASPEHGQIVKQALARIEISVLGMIGVDLTVLPDRRFGMVPVVDRSMEAVRAVRTLGEIVLDHVDLDQMLRIARSAPRLADQRWNASEAIAEAGYQPSQSKRPVVAVAGGSFSTYSYPENIELLQAAGAEILVVDPLRDDQLPPGCQGILFGGGFPEWFIEDLSGSAMLSQQVRDLVARGGPIAAETAGFVWLTEEVNGRPLCGVLSAAAKTGEDVERGYREVIAYSDSVLMPPGTNVTGYQDTSVRVSPLSGERAAWSGQLGRPDGYVHHNVHASLLNLHWAGNPRFAARFASRLASIRP